MSNSPFKIHSQLTGKDKADSSAAVSSTHLSKVTLPTALATRTTDDVFAELKRPLHVQFSQIQVDAKPGYSVDASDAITENSDLNKCDLPALEEGDDEDEDEPNQPVPDIKRISARKRKNADIFDTYLREAEKQPKAVKKISQADEAVQSTRWLIEQAEKQHIISSARDYQLELFERAKKQNIIAVLDTGSGKTFIAVLLLRYIIDQELEDRAIGKPKRVSFFLVDSVTLCHQQHSVLKNNLNQPTDMQKFFDNVCTIHLSQWPKLILLIFDEAHHAKKDHPYARIIKDFYFNDTGECISLPKIFGMTASPVDARDNIKKAAEELEGLLHSQIATAVDPELDAMLPLLKDNPVFRKPFIFVKEASRSLGSWCVDQIWTFCLQEEEVKKLQAKTEQAHHKRRVPEPLEVLEKRKEQIQEAKTIVKGHNFAPPHFATKLSDDLKTRVHYSNNLSTKVVALLSILKDRFQPTLLSTPEAGTPFLKVAPLVGTTSAEAGEMNITFQIANPHHARFPQW
ncbi:hypothetical protein DID88_010505 [Monilinia fructigena]|uniref:Helicase ATP-binding domain-containing protein n=1 Tax=Monilinia fructigena TaxID=38457 RepID=A0A395ILZ4_9HELO|nr:hypothetical protein DID88_010505 [Monilinia fructigena]